MVYEVQTLFRPCVKNKSLLVFYEYIWLIFMQPTGRVNALLGKKDFGKGIKILRWICYLLEFIC